MNGIMIIRDRALTAGEALLGRIWLDGMDIGVTLEKKSRAVDKGIYKGEVYFSPKSQRNVIQLKNTHPRTHIQIHAGNNLADTDGCILIGEFRRGETIVNSRKTLDRMLDWIMSTNDILVSISEMG